MKANLLHNSEIDKPQWDKLVLESLQGSIFTESGYLDTILPGAWSGIEVYEGNELIAVMPIFIKQKWGLKYALQPILAKYWGIVFKKRERLSNHREYSFKKKIVNAVLECIPPNLASLNYNFHPDFDYPLPFFWKSYKLRTAYTCILDPRGKPETEIFNNYASGLKNSIQTAKKNEIKIISDNSVEVLLKILEDIRRSGKTIYEPKYYEILTSILKYGLNTGKSFSLTAVNNTGTSVASSVYLKDHQTVFALTHVISPSFSKTDALSLLVHQAVLKAASLNCKFDFLGSMIEPVEAFNRRFGAIPTPYLNISKKSRFLLALGK